MEFVKSFKRPTFSSIHTISGRLDLILNTRHHEKKRREGRISTKHGYPCYGSSPLISRL